MATMAKTITPLKKNMQDCWLVTWAALLAASDVGAAFEMPECGDKTVQFVGTYGTSSAVFEGSNDGTNFFTLTDPQGNNISKTADAMELVMENPRYVRPKLSGGTTGSVVCTLLVRRGYR